MFIQFEEYYNSNNSNETRLFACNKDRILSITEGDYPYGAIVTLSDGSHHYVKEKYSDIIKSTWEDK